MLVLSHHPPEQRQLLFSLVRRGGMPQSLVMNFWACDQLGKIACRKTLLFLLENVALFHVEDAKGLCIVVKLID